MNKYERNTKSKYLLDLIFISKSKYQEEENKKVYKCRKIEDWSKIHKLKSKDTILIWP